MCHKTQENRGHPAGVVSFVLPCVRLILRFAGSVTNVFFVGFYCVKIKSIKVFEDILESMASSSSQDESLQTHFKFSLWKFSSMSGERS